MQQDHPLAPSELSALGLLHVVRQQHFIDVTHRRTDDTDDTVIQSGARRECQSVRPLAGYGEPDTQGPAQHQHLAHLVHGGGSRFLILGQQVQHLRHVLVPNQGDRIAGRVRPGLTGQQTGVYQVQGRQRVHVGEGPGAALQVGKGIVSLVVRKVVFPALVTLGQNEAVKELMLMEGLTGPRHSREQDMAVAPRGYVDIHGPLDSILVPGVQVIAQRDKIRARHQAGSRACRCPPRRLPVPSMRRPPPRW